MSVSQVACRVHAARGAVRGAEVVLLHGLGSCAEDWGFQVPVLTRNRRVLAADLPGHGRSPALPGLPVIDDFAEMLIHELGPQLAGPAHFVGLSLGGLVALQCAIAHPRWVRSLTIVNAFARMQVPARGRGRMLGRLILLGFAPMSWVGRWVAGGLFPGGGQEQLRALAAARLAANPRRAYLQAALAVARFEARAALPAIRCPALVIAGEADQTVGYQAKQQLAQGIPGARFLSLPGSGHATPVDAHGAFNKALLAFLDSVDEFVI